jgi:two-component system, NarL family, sensor kinase
LAARVSIVPEVDDLPPSEQRSMLRVTQEALANVHRHAGAAKVSVGVRRKYGNLYFRIADNGRGIEQHPREGYADRPRLGVGIPGMRVRLRQFNGDLRITSGLWGTSVLAYIPVSARIRKLRNASFRV